MSELTVDAAAAGGNPAPGTIVRVALTDLDGRSVAGRTVDEVIVQETTARLDLEGRATFDLVPNADISPANTYYTVTIGQGRNADAFLIEKGAGDENLVDCEAFTPGPPRRQGHHHRGRGGRGHRPPARAARGRGRGVGNGQGAPRGQALNRSHDPPIAAL